MDTETSNNNAHYIHQVSYNHRERMVGLFVFSALILFASLLVISGKSQHLFDPRVTCYIDVNSGEGLSQGSVIKLLGKEIGKVSSLNLRKGGKVRVTLALYKSQQALVRQDAKVVINRLVTIGNALIEIDPGSVDAPMLTDGATLPVEETPSLNDLVLGIARIIQSADQGLLAKIETILPDLQQTLDQVRQIITQIATGQGTVGAAVFDKKVEQDLRVVVESGANILMKATGIVSVAEQRLLELEPILIDTQTVMRSVHETTKDLPEMVAELRKTIALTHTALTLVNTELQHLPGIALDARRTLDGAGQLLEGVQTTWPLSTIIPKQNLNGLIPVQPNDD